MPIDPNIARGIAPIGGDLPQIGNMLFQKQQAESRNALLNRQQALEEQQFGAQQQASANDAMMRDKLAEMASIRTQGPQAKADYVASQARQHPEFAKTPFAQFPPEQAFDAMFSRLYTKVTGKTIEPVTPYEVKTQPGPNGSTIVQDGKSFRVVPPRAPIAPAGTPAAEQVRTLTPQEAEAAGFPKGSVVQRLPTGALKPVYKPPAASTQNDAKLRKEAATRLPQLAALDRRVERLVGAVTSISDNPVFSGGVVSEKVLPYTKEGRELQAAIAQVKPILTALTRVPGIGSQSDLEARLDSLQYPDAGFPAETNAANVEEIRAFISDLQSAYMNLLQGGTTAAPSNDGWSIEDDTGGN